MQKIEEVNRPVKVGEVFLVPCTVERIRVNDPCGENAVKEVLTPVINLPHADPESGQQEPHYHVDFRFLSHAEVLYQSERNIRLPATLSIRYLPKAVRRVSHLHVTKPGFVRVNPSSIRKMVNWKCPHRGYDLRQEVPVDGCIKCPLHGLKFDQKTHRCASWWPEELFVSQSGTSGFEISKDVIEGRTKCTRPRWKDWEMMGRHWTELNDQEVREVFAQYDETYGEGFIEFCIDRMPPAEVYTQDDVLLEISRSSQAPFRNDDK